MTKMKAIKYLIVIISLALVSTTVEAQKYAFVDTDYILENLPEYKEAQRKLDELSERWYKEVEERQKNLQKKKDAYEAEKVLMPEEQRQQREKEIETLMQELIEFQKQKFGVKGELFLKRQELIEPIQDKIYNAIKDMAERGNYSFIFDSSAKNSNMLYADDKYDKSDLILRDLK